eukprot:4158006-Amphidinium_carterae.1
MLPLIHKASTSKQDMLKFLQSQFLRGLGFEGVVVYLHVCCKQIAQADMLALKKAVSQTKQNSAGSCCRVMSGTPVAAYLEDLPVAKVHVRIMKIVQ